MKVYLRFKSLRYALKATEFLYNLHPLILKEALDLKRSLGSILGQNIDLKELTYEQREQLSTLRVKEDNLPNYYDLFNKWKYI